MVTVVDNGDGTFSLTVTADQLNILGIMLEDQLEEKSTFELIWEPWGQQAILAMNEAVNERDN